MAVKITLDQAPELITTVLRAGLVANLLSSPGVGKSDVAKQIADNAGLELIDVRLSQLDSVDLAGFPTFNEERTKASYIPMDMFPVEGDPVPEGKKGWLILFDEMNSASLAVQAACYKVILDRMVGMHHLHKNVVMIAAGNLATDKAIVNRLSTAMQSRMVHFTIEVSQKAWLKWADKNGVDHRVKSFVQFKPEGLHSFKPSHDDLTFACPRTWAFVSKLLDKIPTIGPEHIALLTGTVGEGMGREFYSYTQIFERIPTIQQIMDNPAGVRFDDEPAIHYALTGLVGHHFNKKSAEKLMVFVNRLAIDFQVVALRAGIAKDRDMLEVPAVKEWITRNASELM